MKAMKSTPMIALAALATVTLGAGLATAQDSISALKGHDSKAPIDLSADRAEAQDRVDRAIFAGNVVVRHPLPLVLEQTNATGERRPVSYQLSDYRNTGIYVHKVISPEAKLFLADNRFFDPHTGLWHPRDGDPWNAEIVRDNPTHPVARLAADPYINSGGSDWRPSPSSEVESRLLSGAGARQGAALVVGPGQPTGWAARCRAGTASGAPESAPGPLCCPSLVCSPIPPGYRPGLRGRESLHLAGWGDSSLSCSAP